ncbi:hypothetical protein DD238_008207 [Peronospora effusa]|nr:hypothetical protein DD238_008208 [Peronospora effusa]RMX62688.1 hypothetical protein DD238_008207 [Peronospora effusa]
MARIAKILDSAPADDMTLLGVRVQELRDEQYTQWIQRDITLENAKVMLLKEGVDEKLIKTIRSGYANFLRETRYEDPLPRLRRV